MIKYVDVVALMQTTGVIIPKTIIWEDGRTFEVDKVLDIRKKASTRGGGAGLRYTIKICGKEKYIFLNENKWFFETD